MIKFSDDKPVVTQKKEDKRVTQQQDKLIADNLNYSLALREVDHNHVA